MNRVLLSLFIIFHLSCVFLGPLAESMVRPNLGKTGGAYLDLLAFGANWDFFAPNPRKDRYYVEWEAIGADEQILSRGSWPAKVSPYWLTERHNRRVFSGAFMIGDAARAPRMIAPWVCRELGVQAVRLWRVSVPILGISDVQNSKFKPLEAALTAENRQGLGHQFCGEF